MEIFIFNSTMKKMKLVLSNKNVMEAHETKEINKAGQLVFSTDFKTGKQIKQTDVVFIHVKEDRYHPYKIVQTSMPTTNSIQFTCIEYAYYLFNKDGLVHDKRPNKLSVGDVIQEVIKGTKWQVGYVDSSLPKFTGVFYWITRTECFSKLVEQTGVELEFYVTMSDNKINGRYIDAYKQVGTDTHQRFTYGMNALEVVAESSSVDTVTKVYPRGSGEMYTSEGDGERKLTIESVEWSKAKGDPTDKPLGQDYLVYGSAEYDLDNGNQPSAIVEFQDEKDANALIKKAFRWLKQNNRPQVQFKAKVSEVGDLKLGDRVVIDREDMNIKYVTRVFKIDRNLLNEKLNTIELGDVVSTSLADTLNKTINESIVKNNTSIKKEFHTIVNANGQTITYGPDEPQTKKKGDTWFKPADIVEGVQQYDVYVWDGEKWVLTIGNQLQNELIAKVDQAQKDTEAAKQQAQEASDKADAIENNFNTQIGEINHNIDSAKQDAQDAINQANIAIGKADFNNQEITDLKQKQDETGQKISSIEQNYNGLKQTVTDNAAKQESDRVQLSGMIADKVSNGEFNSYKTQTADKMSAIITNTNNLFVNSSMELLPLEQSFAYITNPDKVAIIDNPFKDFPELKDVVVKDGFSYVNNKSPKILKIQRGGKVTTEWFKVVGGTKFFAEFDFYSNTGSGWQIAVVQEGENGWWATSGGAYTFTTFDQDKWSHWRYSFDLLPQCTRVKLEFYPVGGNDDSITYFDNLVCMKANIATSMVQQTQSSITELVQNQDSLNKRVQTAEGTISDVSNEVKGLDSKLTQTADLIKGEVSSLDEKTKASLALLQDDINLKVNKDDVITQINLSPEGVLIDGKKTHITNQTIIDDASIQSAAIKDLSADKITTGTLNAANVNITNLDVNTLAGDYSQFLKTAWKDNNSYSEITPDGLKFFKEKDNIFSKDTYLSIYSNQLTWRTSNKAWHYINQSNNIIRNNLTIGAVTNDAEVPASINVRSSGYDTMTSVSQNGMYSGKYTFVGKDYGMTISEGMEAAQDALRGVEQPEDLGPGMVFHRPTYAVRVAAENNILMNVINENVGQGFRFDTTTFDNETSVNHNFNIVYQDDNWSGLFIKSIPTYKRTYSYSSNMFVTSNGYIGRATSAKKYKQDIEYIDNIEEAKRTLDIQPAEWADKKVMEHRAKSRSTKNDAELNESLRRRYIGFIADDFADAGFEKLVLRDDKGEVEEFQYDRLSVYHHQMIKDLYSQIDELKKEIKQLKGE